MNSDDFSEHRACTQRQLQRVLTWLEYHVIFRQAVNQIVNKQIPEDPVLFVAPCLNRLSTGIHLRLFAQTFYGIFIFSPFSHISGFLGADQIVMLEGGENSQGPWQLVVVDPVTSQPVRIEILARKHPSRSSLALFNICRGIMIMTREECWGDPEKAMAVMHAEAIKSGVPSDMTEKFAGELRNWRK